MTVSTAPVLVAEVMKLLTCTEYVPLLASVTVPIVKLRRQDHLQHCRRSWFRSAANDK